MPQPQLRAQPYFHEPPTMLQHSGCPTQSPHIRHITILAKPKVNGKGIQTEFSPPVFSGVPLRLSDLNINKNGVIAIFSETPYSNYRQTMLILK
ncbi:hypothetical protein ScPMuIL_001576 [Solemya velum]